MIGIGRGSSHLNHFLIAKKVREKDWSDSMMSIINLPTAFWGLLGPQKDVTVDFNKLRPATVKEIPILLVSLACWGLKRPQKVNSVSFLLKQ